ncbi:MAG: sigma-70 family RNA polymerase sigma factor [Chloroflexi bacterium]|nr:sigma-70 family RNA polymerase sigma factor [Chloroflexota bacterium]MBU1746269.1 sigma-70 family RNA polymerase sigma factor [Chloroflexota bacterium]
MESTDEARLIARAKKGDPAAFAELYDRHHEAIYTYVYYRVGGDAPVAEDLTGDVFVRLVEHIDRFTYQGRPIRAWLYTIARNLVTDHRRTQARVTIAPLSDSLCDREHSQPAAVVQQRLDQECLATALQHLTEEQQQVIVLKFIEGQSNAEIAALLDKTEGAIKSLQHRALAALRRAIEKERCYEP